MIVQYAVSIDTSTKNFCQFVYDKNFSTTKKFMNYGSMEDVPPEQCY